MTTLDTTIPPRIKGVISTIGIPATLISRTGRTYPASGVVTEGTVVRTSVTVTPIQMVETVKEGKDYEASCYMATPVPSVEMELDVSGTVWRIVEVTPYSTGTLVAAYKLGLKR